MPVDLPRVLVGDVEAFPDLEVDAPLGEVQVFAGGGGHGGRQPVQLARALGWFGAKAFFFQVQKEKQEANKNLGTSNMTFKNSASAKRPAESTTEEKSPAATQQFSAKIGKAAKSGKKYVNLRRRQQCSKSSAKKIIIELNMFFLTQVEVEFARLLVKWERGEVHPATHLGGVAACRSDQAVLAHCKCTGRSGIV